MIKKSRKIIASLLMALSLVSIFPTVNAFADANSDVDFLHNQCTETKNKNGKTLYEKDGKYYLMGTDDNYMAIIPRSTFADDFYAQDDGSIAINKWEYSYDTNNNKYAWRYFDSDGIKLTGLQTINGVKYYFNNSGNLGVGWFYDMNKTYGNHWRYSYSDGSIHEGWIQDNGKWHYIYSDGTMAKDTTTPDGYYVNKKGVWV